MSCQYSLVFVFLCSFAALSVSTETCGKELLEGTSCTIQLPKKNIDKSNEIKWVHDSSGDVIHWKNGRIRKNTLGAKIEEDGSLTFESVNLMNTGKYTYTVFNAEGSQIDTGENEIKVYAKAPKPTVTFNRDADGNATLTCDTGDRTDLTVSWYKEDKIIQNEKNPKLFLTSAQVQEKKTYSCSVSNPVSNEGSNSVTVSFLKTCGKMLLERTSCTIQLPTKNYEKPNEIIWIHLSSGDFILRNKGKIRTNTPDLTVEEDGSLTFHSASLNNTGKYTYTVFNAEGTQIDAGEKEINVYVLKTCGKELQEGTSCTIKLPTKNIDTSGEIIWIHLCSGDFVLRNKGKIRTNTPDLTVEEDGSLTFHSASLNNTGKYTYTVFNAEGTQIDAGEKEINVYDKKEPMEI